MRLFFVPQDRWRSLSQDPRLLKVAVILAEQPGGSFVDVKGKAG
jgi:hypothetical protein